MPINAYRKINLLWFHLPKWTGCKLAMHLACSEIHVHNHPSFVFLLHMSLTEISIGIGLLFHGSMLLVYPTCDYHSLYVKFVEKPSPIVELRLKRNHSPTKQPVSENKPMPTIDPCSKSKPSPTEWSASKSNSSQCQQATPFKEQALSNRTNGLAE